MCETDHRTTFSRVKSAIWLLKILNSSDSLVYRARGAEVHTDSSLELSQLDIFYWRVVYATFPHVERVRSALHHWPVFIHHKFFTCFIKTVSDQADYSSLYVWGGEGTVADKCWTKGHLEYNSLMFNSISVTHKLFTPIRTQIQIWRARRKADQMYVRECLFSQDSVSFLSSSWSVLLISTNTNITSPPSASPPLFSL